MTYPQDDKPQARKGLLASLSAALSPQPIPEDDSGPLTAPKGVLTAMVITIVSGAIYVFSGGLGLLTIGQLMESSKDQYQQWINDCTAQFGGFGSAAITETSATGSAAACQGLTEMTAASWDSYRTASLVVSAVFLAMGLALIAAGYFLKLGRKWARRTVVAVAVITVAAAMLLGMSSPIILVATLLLMVAVVLCYLSSGATFFLRAAARRHG